MSEVNCSECGHPHSTHGNYSCNVGTCHCRKSFGEISLDEIKRLEAERDNWKRNYDAKCDEIDRLKNVISHRDADIDALLAKIEKAQPAIELAIKHFEMMAMLETFEPRKQTIKEAITILEGLKDAKEEK